MMNHYRNLLIIIGTLLVSIILYARLLKTRIPHDFVMLATGYYYISSMFITISMLILLISNLIILYKIIYSKRQQTSFFTEILQKVIKHPYNPILLARNSMIELDAFIKNRVPFYDAHQSYVDLLLINLHKIFFNSTLKRILVIIIFRLLPQVIVCIGFSYDLCYNNSFFYFYKSLWLLIFPLIFSYIAYSVRTFVDTNLESLNDILELKIILESELKKGATLSDFVPISVFDWQGLLLTPEGEDYICHNNLSPETLETYGDDTMSASYSLKYAVNFMKVLFQMSISMTHYERHKLYVESIFNIIKYFIFFIGWAFICY